MKCCKGYTNDWVQGMITAIERPGEIRSKGGHSLCRCGRSTNHESSIYMSGNHLFTNVAIDGGTGLKHCTKSKVEERVGAP